jgi:hypothetical protein
MMRRENIKPLNRLQVGLLKEIVHKLGDERCARVPICGVVGIGVS